MKFRLSTNNNYEAPVACDKLPNKTLRFFSTRIPKRTSPQRGPRFLDILDE